ncbi:MAG: ATP-dependent DNA helicase [Armatimonadota bacterium]|nr:ATP-dependent DNA helicase [Armatimonadota bacterium]MDR5702446.1 ATP-dependent DNA helicase [Armatimonadota bacterium]
MGKRRHRNLASRTRKGEESEDQLPLGLEPPSVELLHAGLPHESRVAEEPAEFLKELGELSVSRILADLNEEQRRAVTHGEGPLLIVAGAGTGKTTVITRRIAYLIATKRARPREILALTFTDKAAAEMEERVDLLVPYGYADVWISTFHAFGDRILRENALEIGLNPDFRILSKAEQIIFFREHLFDFPLDYYRPLGDPTKYVEAMITLFSRAKDEDVSPEEYLTYAEKLLAEADPTDPEAVQEARRQLEIARTYQRYQELLAKEGLVDFGDLITLTLKLFRERPHVLRRYQEQFKYILVDEFQDTNYAQFQLTKLLASRHENITVVGDDDQSIYKFRGAAISNILNFMDTYPHATQIVLTRNYRSSQLILDAAYRLIRYNDPDRLEVKNQLDKRLFAVHMEGQPVRHLHFDSLSSEADAVASIIAEKVEKGAYRYKDFAILVRSNNDADPFLRSLNMRGIPFHFSGGQGLYQREEIRLVMAFLRSLTNPYDNLSLYHLGSSPLYQIDPGDLARCLAVANRKNRSLEHIFDQLHAYEELEEVSPESRAAIAKLVEDLKEMRSFAQHHVTGRVLYEYLVNRTGYIRRLVASGNVEDEIKVANLAKFFDIVAKVAQLLRYDNVHAFVEYMDKLIEAGDDPTAAELSGPDLDAVHVMTVHKAKGLEFPVVFLVSCVSDRFPTRNRNEGLSLPDPLIKDILPSGDFHLQEERRLFYVGMTRAQKELYLTSARDYGGVRPRKVSQFVLEAMDMPKVDPEVAKASAVEAIERHAPPVVESLMGQPLPEDSPLILSFRQIDDYDTCPLKYKYIHILRVPVMRDHRVVYGAALHEAVREYNRRKARNQPMNLEELISYFERVWTNEGFVSREHEDYRFEEGRQVLRQFFLFEEGSGVTPTLVEMPFSFQLGKTRVKGRWDRVDVHGDEVVIVDFKTSDVRDTKEANRRTRESLQLAIYALAYKEVYGRLPSWVELRFLGSQQVLVGRAEPHEEYIREAIEVIEKVAKGIRAQRFVATPDFYRACRFCAFNQICPYTAAGE